jgi:hypothetical protein
MRFLSALGIAALLAFGQADAASLPAPPPVQHFVDNNGNALAGGQVFTYLAGTTTKVNTYIDSSETTQNSDPIILDGRGEANIWLDPNTTYKFVLSSPTDTDPPTRPIQTADNITAFSNPFTTPVQILLTNDKSWSPFANSALVVANHGNNNAVIGYELNDLAPSTDALPSGVIGYGRVASGATGNQAFGVYGLGGLHATAGTAVAAEFTVRNNCGPPDINLPPNESIGTPTCAANGLQVTSGGHYNSSLGIDIGTEAGADKTFTTAEYIGKTGYSAYGLFVDAPATGSYEDAVLQSNGNGIPLQIGIVSAMQPNNTAIAVLDNTSTGRFSVRQNGDTYVHDVQPTGGPASITICSGAGTGGTCSFDTGSGDGSGTITITAGTSPSSTGTVAFNFALAVGADGSNCSLQAANGTGSWVGGTSFVIQAQNSSSVGFAWANGGATSLTETDTYKVNYFCPGH